MITSHVYKVHWWGVAANGSASMCWAFQNIFRIDYDKDNINCGRRNTVGTKFIDGYEIIVNARNPFNHVVAEMYDLEHLENFDEFIKTGLGTLQCVKQVKWWEEAGITPTRYIKCEDMYGSLLKIPSLKAKTLECKDQLIPQINTVGYNRWGKGRQRLVESKYWNEENVAIALENKYFNRLFEAGYDKEGWK